MKEWKEKGVRFLGYINPFMAIEKELYAYASKQGYCVKDREGKDYLVTITTFPAAMIDFTNPAAYEWYKNLIKENMIGIGMGGWMADFGEYLPVDAVLYSGEDPQLIHNRWPAIWAKLNREAIGVVQLECAAACNLLNSLLLHKECHLLKLLLALLQCLAELYLFLGKLVENFGLVLNKLWIRCAIKVYDNLGNFGQECSLDAQMTAITYSSSDKAPQDIALSYVGRCAAPLVAQDKGAGPYVVCDYAH